MCSDASGVADLWKQWESKITELKDGLPELPEDGQSPLAAARQHPSLGSRQREPYATNTRDSSITDIEDAYAAKYQHLDSMC